MMTDGSHSFCMKNDSSSMMIKLHEFLIMKFLTYDVGPRVFLKRQIVVSKIWHLFANFFQNYLEFAVRKFWKIVKICHHVANFLKRLLWPMFSISANYPDSSRHFPIYWPKQFCKPRGFKEATLNHAYTTYNI
jgi:hypothetical protein